MSSSSSSNKSFSTPLQTPDPLSNEDGNISGDWVEKFHQKQGKNYWKNIITGVTSWKPPKHLQPTASDEKKEESRTTDQVPPPPPPPAVSEVSEVSEGTSVSSSVKKTAISTDEASELSTSKTAIATTTTTSTSTTAAASNTGEKAGSFDQVLSALPSSSEDTHPPVPPRSKKYSPGSFKSSSRLSSPTSATSEQLSATENRVERENESSGTCTGMDNAAAEFRGSEYNSISNSSSITYSTPSKNLHIDTDIDSDGRETSQASSALLQHA